MSKKSLSLLMVLVMVISIVISPTFNSSAFAQNNVNVQDTYQISSNSKDVTKQTSITLSDNNISLSEAKVIDVAVNLGYVPNLKNIQWTLGGKSLNKWLKYDKTAKTYTGDPFITFSEGPTLDGTIIRAKLKIDLVYGTVNLNEAGRTLYPPLLGDFDFVAKDTLSDKSASTIMKINAYDYYHTYDEIKPEIDRITSLSKSGRYIQYKSLGKTVQGRDSSFVILAKDKASVDQYLNVTMPMMTENPKAPQDMIKNGKMGDYKVPIWFNNIHPDEAPGVDAILKLFNKFAIEDTISYNTTLVTKVPKTDTKDGTQVETTTDKTVTINVANALDNVIFLFNFTENPDGRALNTRTNANGFDVNRDNAYQTQIEARLTTSEIVKWKPVTFLDFHGFMSGFLIEPCTSPHDPNFEYDLLIDNMLEQAHLMGNAGIANTKYTNYEIPYEDYAGGWDDGVPAYTAVFAMEFGSLAHTVEIPEINEDSMDAQVAVGLANVKYVVENKDRLYNNQLEYYKRGVEGLDVKEKVDPWMVNAAGDEIGRSRGANDNFFPEYYVLPVAKSLQKNSLEAYKMVEYLLRNGIKVAKTSEEINIENTTYPKGSYVIDMHQALRGYANEVLYDGYDVSDFTLMYAEIVNAFSDTRGFNKYEVRKAGAFSGKLQDVTSVSIPKTKVSMGSERYVIGNTNNDAVKAVNELLNRGKSVEMLVAPGLNYKKGDYVVSKVDLNSVKNKYLLDVTAYNGTSNSIKLLKPTVAAPLATGHLTFTLRELGFTVSNNVADGNIIVTDSSADVKTSIYAGKPYVGIGGDAMSFVKNKLITTDFDYVNTDYEGLMRAVVAQESMITSGYSEKETIYDSQGGYIGVVPEGAKVLTSISTGDDYFKAGWWPDTDIAFGIDKGKLLAKGKALAITTKVGNSDITIFANNLVNKAHPQNDWRMLANAIFTSSKVEVNMAQVPANEETAINHAATGKSLVLIRAAIDRAASLIKTAVADKAADDIIAE
ncbi:MAG: hypothetical protein ACI8WT_003963 [Clostridium sp.]|jgi:hypothetical protein